MNLTRISTMVRAGALAALLVVGTSAAAFALPIVNFSTTGDFAGAPTTAFTVTGPGGNSATFTFTGVNTSLNTPTNTSFGDITTTVTGAGAIAPGTSVGFTLTVDQASPLPNGQGNFVGTLSGSIIANNQGNFFLLFSTPSITIGDVTYTLQQPVGGYAIVPPNVNGGVTTIQGAINATSPVPEPASMVLLGTGLLAAFRARRKVGIQ